MTSRSPFIAIALFITLIGVPLGIIYPSRNELVSTSRAIYQEYQLLEERSRRGQDAKRAKQEYESLAVQRPVLRSLAVEQGDELAFITALEKLAEEHHVKERLELRVESAKQVSRYQTVPLTIYLEGSYPTIVSYIAAVQRLSTVVTITSISMVPREDRVFAQLEGVVYQHTTTPQITTQ